MRSKQRESDLKKAVKMGKRESKEKKSRVGRLADRKEGRKERRYLC